MRTLLAALTTFGGWLFCVVEVFQHYPNGFGPPWLMVIFFTVVFFLLLALSFILFSGMLFPRRLRPPSGPTLEERIAELEKEGLLTILVRDRQNLAFIKSFPANRCALLDISASGDTLITAGEGVGVWSPPTGDHYSIDANLYSNAAGYQAKSNRVGILNHDSGEFRFWDVASRQYLNETFNIARTEKANNTEVKFSPDGQLVAFGETSAIEVLSLRTKQSYFIETPYARAIAFSPDSKHLTATTTDIPSAGIPVWGAATGVLEKRLPGAAFAFSPMVFSPDSSKLVRFEESGPNLKIWHIDAGGLPETISTPALTNAVDAVAFLDESRVAIGGSIVDLISKTITTPGEHGRWVLGMAFSPDGSLLLTDDKNEIRLWNVQTGNLIWKILSPLAPDVPQRASSSYYYSIERNPDDPVYFRPDGKSVIVQNSEYNLATGERINSFSPYVRGYASDWYYTRSDFDVIEVRNYLDTNSVFVVKRESNYTALNITTSISQKTAATSGAHLWMAGYFVPEIWIWNTPDWTRRKIIPVSMYEYFRADISPDEKWVAAGAEAGAGGEFSVYNVETAEPVVNYRDRISPCIGFGFFPDSRRVALGTVDGLRIWDAPSNSLLSFTTNEVFLASAVAVSPDGKTIAIGRYDGTVLMIETPEYNRLNIQTAVEGLKLTFYGRAGLSYSIESSQDLRTWSEVTSVQGADAIFEKSLPFGTATFYRIR